MLAQNKKIKKQFVFQIKYFKWSIYIISKKLNPKLKIMSDGSQSKILDSKSWILSIQHFKKYNQLGESQNKNEGELSKQIQYATASTFDKWLAVRSIDVDNIMWSKIYEMKMAMIVMNSFIQFNRMFEPQSIVLAYMDGSIDYSPWSKIQKNYCLQIQAAKKRQITKTLPQVIQKSKRPAFINIILDYSKSEEKTFMLETVCFLYKRRDFIYVMNFRGELKIFKVTDNESKIVQIQKIELGCKIIKAQCLVGCKTSSDEGIFVGICFESVPTPLVLQISPTITKQKILKKIQILCQKQLSSLEKEIKSQIKLMTYDPSSKVIITCTQSNEITIFSFDYEQLDQTENIYIVQIEKMFYLNYKDRIQIINDLDVKDDKLVILCKHSFSLYDIKDDFMIKEGQKLKEQLEVGKLVEVSSRNEKPLLLVKKKFDYTNPNTRKSTTLHLFIGK